MKQTQKQIVNVIVNQEKPKTKRRKRPSSKPIDDEPNNQTLQTTKPSKWNQKTAYNPNIIGNRIPSYGLASVNPTLDSRDMTITSLINKIQQPEPSLKDYRGMIQEEIDNSVRNTLQNTGEDFLNNYLSNNETFLSRATSVNPNVEPSVYFDENTNNEPSRSIIKKKGRKAIASYESSTQRRNRRNYLLRKKRQGKTTETENLELEAL